MRYRSRRATGNATDFFADVFQIGRRGVQPDSDGGGQSAQRGPIRYPAKLPVAIHVDGRQDGIHAFASDPAVGKSSVIVFSPEFVLFDQMRGKVSVEYPARLTDVPRCVEIDGAHGPESKLGGVLESGPGYEWVRQPHTRTVEGVGT